MTPDDVDPGLWSRYVAGAKAFDKLYAAGARCPMNDEGARCKCTSFSADICRYWHGLEKLGREIGGATWIMIQRME
jgi:hypothetical protein